MFDLIEDIIGHTFSSYNSMESAIGYACIVLIIVFCVATIDLISQFISVFTRIK